MISEKDSVNNWAINQEGQEIQVGEEKIICEGTYIIFWVAMTNKEFINGKSLNFVHVLLVLMKKDLNE